jgi:hypothetical protein
MVATLPAVIRKSLSKLVAASLLALGFTVPSAALAITECAVVPERFFVGDSILWVNYLGGGVGVIQQSDPDFKPTLAVVMTAVMAQKAITVRYAEDGVNCSNSAVPYNIAGIWFAR